MPPQSRHAVELAPSRSDPDSFLTALDPAAPASFSAIALKACGDRPKCKVMGWTDGDHVALSLPLTANQIAALSFSYRRDRSTGDDRMLWNCVEFPTTAPAHCLKRQLLVNDTPSAVLPAPVSAPLDGVRRRSDDAAPPAPVVRSP